jgi:chloride channel protein, CIC family
MAVPDDRKPLATRALRAGLAWVAPLAAPLDLRLLGRTLLHAAVLGGLAGAVGAGFFAALEVGQRLLLTGLAGYVPLRAAGESLLGELEPGTFRPWLLALLPALGGLASGLITSFAPECGGGGGDATIEAYHLHGGRVRARVIPVKTLASVAALATGGAGGREGPTMHIGAGLGALIGRWLPTTARERRILVVAGVAAGISAVFRTPLGAALLAVEMLYRDDFESDALVPAIFASVIAYSVVASIFGESTLFGRLPAFPFVPRHLPLYGALAVLLSLGGVAFVGALRGVARAFARLPGPRWLRPALGGLAMGAFATGVILLVGARFGQENRGVGLLGSGYGAVQAAIAGSPGMTRGWTLVGLLLALSAAKMIAAALTIGSGASAGDFAPSLTIGGLLGAAFGHGAALLLGDPSIQPAAFVVVGMGTFYGGLAHTPLAALVLVSELAGSYDLLVPMMLSIGVAYVALRRWTLYPAQPRSQRDSPAHPELRARDLLVRIRAQDVAAPVETGPLEAAARLPAGVTAAALTHRQRLLPLCGAGGAFTGLADVDAIRAAATDPDLAWAVLADVAAPFVSVPPGATLARVGELLAEHGLRQLPVVEGGRIVGYVGEAEIARVFLQAVTEPEAARPG